MSAVAASAHLKEIYWKGTVFAQVCEMDVSYIELIMPDLDDRIQFSPHADQKLSIDKTMTLGMRIIGSACLHVCDEQDRPRLSSMCADIEIEQPSPFRPGANYRLIMTSDWPLSAKFEEIETS